MAGRQSLNLRIVVRIYFRQQAFLAQLVEALVLETSKCKFESYRKYKGELTERGSDLLAKQKMPYTHEVASSNLATPTNNTGSISIGRLRALGACGCRFESCLPDKWISSKRGICVALKKQRRWFDSTLIHKRFIAQLDRAFDYESKGLRFESVQSLKNSLTLEFKVGVGINSRRVKRNRRIEEEIERQEAQ